MKRFRNWSISTKVMSISMLTIIIMVCGMLFYYLPLVKGKLMDEKQLATKHSAEVVETLMASYEARVKAGELTLEEAQKKMIADIKVLRYDGSEYFWLLSNAGKFVAHGVKPELIGKDMGDDALKDSHGKYFVKEMVTVGKTKGEGFIEYYFPRPGQTQAVPKLGFVKM
jgi:methyl-accepting chemotaxis protein